MQVTGTGTRVGQHNTGTAAAAGGAEAEPSAAASSLRVPAVTQGRAAAAESRCGASHGVYQPEWCIDTLMLTTVIKNCKLPQAEKISSEISSHGPPGRRVGCYKDLRPRVTVSA